MAFLPANARTTRLILAAILAAVIPVASGCHKGALYQARSLPPAYMAPRVSSLQNVDFSRLARSVGNSDLLYPGDVVEVSIATGLEEEEPLAIKVRVAEDGTITAPLVGAVHVAGLPFTQAEQAVRVESIRRGKFVNPNVSIILDTRRSNRITVVGAVEEPGTYEVPASSSDVLAALVLAGGLAEDAGTVLEVRHPPHAISPAMAERSRDGNNQDSYATEFAGYRPEGLVSTPPRTVRIDLEQAALNSQGDLQLEDGSTVMVMRKPKRYVHVMGLVRGADQFEMPEDQEMRLLDAISLAGGRTLEIADTVHVVRHLPGHTEPVVIEASVRGAKQGGTSNIRLAAGDVVSVEETPLTFVVGSIRDLMRFGFSSAIPMF